MADVHSPEIRSKNMRAIKSKDTKLEVMFRKALYRKGYRYRVNYKGLPGKPDLFLSKYKVAIFINGCFWHAHSCSIGKLPDTRKEFWRNKFNKNICRDKKNISLLLEDGYRVLIIWECAVRGKDKIPLNLLLVLVKAWIESKSPSGFIDSNGLVQQKVNEENVMAGLIGTSQ